MPSWTSPTVFVVSPTIWWMPHWTRLTPNKEEARESFHVLFKFVSLFLGLLFKCVTRDHIPQLTRIRRLCLSFGRRKEAVGIYPTAFRYLRTFYVQAVHHIFFYSCWRKCVCVLCALSGMGHASRASIIIIVIITTGAVKNSMQQQRLF